MDIRVRIQNMIFVHDRLEAVCEALREADATNHPLQVALELIDQETRSMQRELIGYDVKLAEAWRIRSQAEEGGQEPSDEPSKG